jgi:hypothetical protein
MAKGLTGVALAVTLFSGGAASATTLRASAGHSTGHRHHGRHDPVVPTGVFGTVAAVNGSSTAGACGVADSAGTFTLTAVHGTTDTVDVSTTSTFSEHGVTSPSFANVCLGEKVGAVGTISSSTVTATGVFIAPPPMPKPQGVFGTVASVNGSAAAGACGVADSAGTFTLTAVPGTTDTVDVSTTTKFGPHGVTTPSFANVCVGVKVGAIGTISSSTVTAAAVFVIVGRTPPPLHDSSVPDVHSGPHGSPKGVHGVHPYGHPTNDHGFGLGFGGDKGHSTGHSSGHHSH